MLIISGCCHFSIVLNKGLIRVTCAEVARNTCSDHSILNAVRVQNQTQEITLPGACHGLRALSNCFDHFVGTASKYGLV
jgi:hypothetical protein